MNQEWTFEHTIECSVSSEFAWDFWTNVGNWALDADIDSVEIQGAFVAGAQGVTQSKSSGRIEWRVEELQPGRAVLAQLSQLRAIFGIFSFNFVVKSSVSIAEL